MKKHILPAVLCLALMGGLAVAQNINKALQLSQDSTGLFGIDTNLGVYFPGHILSSSSRPIPSIAGTGTPTISGTDTMGTVTFGASATTATVTFGTAYVTVPACVVVWQASATVSPVSYTLATTSIALTQGTGTSNKANYWCSSAS